MTVKISLAEPVSQLRRVPIAECGEPLVDFRKVCPKLLIDRPRFNYEREHFVRETVALKLKAATESLPEPYRISIIEGWRPMLVQKRMYMAVWNRSIEIKPNLDNVARKRLVNRWTAPLDPRVPPPHTTGAAIDVILTNADGEPYDLHSPFPAHDSKSFPTEAKGISEEARKNRRILKEAMEAHGLTNYPSEYWHFSYGDQGWAYRGGHASAIYNVAEPPGWIPHEELTKNEPFTFLMTPPDI